MWHAARKSFFWVDIEGRKLFEFHWQTKSINEWSIPYKVSLVVESMDKDFVLLAVQGGLAWLHLDSGNTSWLTHIEGHVPTNRTNDGGCDASGRLWIGTMDGRCKKGLGSLYCFSKDFDLQKKLNHLSVPNGIVWSEENNRMYHIDSATSCVKSYFFDIESGDIELEKTIITVPDEMGVPDGMCRDKNGMLWIAHWDGFGVYCWNPGNGKLVAKIDVPVPQVTSCAFGGEKMDQLIITTARQGLSEDQLKKYPESGCVFIAAPGVQGVEENIFPR
jgi:sugar lactone lactonase YvrE